MVKKNTLAELKTQVTSDIKPNTNRETTSQKIQDAIVNSIDTINQLPGKRELPQYECAIEKGYLTLGSLPKLVFLDTASDPYRDLYGPLLVPINPNNREHQPDVIVLSLKESLTTTDVWYCLDLVEPVAITATAHGLLGELYIGADGEITDKAPGTYRTIHCGSVIDANTILLRPVNESYKPRTPALELRAKAYQQLSMDDIADITVALNGGAAHLYERESLVTASPTSQDMIDTFFDPLDYRAVYFSNLVTGMTITLAQPSYVSDIDLRLADLYHWIAEINVGDPGRDTLYIKVYAASSDTSPAATLKVWDRADGPLDVDFYRLIQRTSVNMACEKIEIEWDQSYGTWTDPASNGSVESIQIYGQPIDQKIRLAPQVGRYQTTWTRLDLHPEDKILCFGREIDNWHARVGARQRVEELYHQQLFGMYSDYNPTPGSVYDYTVFDERMLREWADGTQPVSGVRSTDRDIVVIDLESPIWELQYGDDQATQDAKIKRWLNSIEIIRRILPDVLLSAYSKPEKNFNASEWVSFRDKQIRQDDWYTEERELNKQIYDALDILTPSIYQANQTWKRWITTVEMQAEHCHYHGKLYVPHFSYIDYVTSQPLPDFLDYLEALWEVADGVLMWDSLTAITWQDSWKEDYAAIMRSFVREKFPARESTGAVNTFGELPLPGSLIVPATRLVTNDPTPSNNGSYMLTGPIGSKGATWLKV